MAITIDGATRRIILDSASVTAAQIWSAWVDWHGANSQWPMAFSQVGGDDLGSGLFIPVYYFLENGWRVRPMEANHNLVITGNLFVQGGGVPVVSTLGTYQVNVNYTVPVQAQAVATGGGTAPSAAEVADEVRVELAPELLRILELALIHGLVAGQPLIVTATSRVAGSVSQQITESGGGTTATVSRL